MDEKTKIHHIVKADDSPLLKGSDVARRLNISRSNAYNLMQSGKIPVVRIGRCLRVREEDLEAFIRQNTFPSGTRHEKTLF